MVLYLNKKIMNGRNIIELLTISQDQKICALLENSITRQRKELGHVLLISTKFLTQTV